MPTEMPKVIVTDLNCDQLFDREEMKAAFENAKQRIEDSSDTPENKKKIIDSYNQLEESVFQTFYQDDIKYDEEYFGDLMTFNYCNV